MLSIDALISQPKKHIASPGGHLSSRSMDEKYGFYVEKTLIPQIARLSAQKMSANEITFKFVNSDNKRQEKIINTAIDNIFPFVNFNRVIFLAEEKLSLEGNTVIIFENVKNDRVVFYVPNTNITRINVGTGEIEYLLAIRYSKGGNLINITTEVWSDGVYQKNIDTFNEDVGEEAINNIDSYQSWSDKNKSRILKSISKSDKYNEIPAVYIQNLPRADFRGTPDVDVNSLYVGILNKLWVRFHWEIEFNKPKLGINQELGTSAFMDTLQDQYRTQAIDENFIIKNNNFYNVNGDGSNGFEYYETTNQNLQNLMIFFNYHLKKLWEHSGFHMAASDVGKQLTDYQMKQEKSFEEMRFAWKTNNMKKSLKLLIWKVMMCSTNSEIKKIARGGDFSPFNFEITLIPFDTNLEKEIIENTIMKIQANLSDRIEGLKEIQPTLTDEEAEKMSQRFFENNKKDLEEMAELEEYKQPIQANAPTISNPQGKENNQKIIKKGDKNG